MEDFDEFSNFCLALKFQIPDEDDPTQSLEFIEQGIDHFLKNSFTKEQIDFFSGFLYEIVTEIWGRANFAKEAIQRINQFFQKCLDFIASRIQEENVVIFEILNKILESPVRTGFYQNESGNNRIIKIELDKYKSKDSQNESSHSSPQTEKDKQESKETQSQNNEPEFISSTYRFVSPLLLENIEYFGKIGGFRKIISQILGNDYEVSVFRIQSLIQPIIKCSRIFNEQFLGLILPDIQKILGLILDLDFNQLRNENRKELDSLVDSVELFTRRINSKAADEMRERFNLKLSLKYLISPFLETRVMGINDLSSLTTHVMGNIVDNSTHYFYKSFEWLNTENLIDWIEEEKIVDLLINERMHPEILKRSGSIFEFLAKYDKLTMNQFEKIWSYADGSHKSTTEIIYSLFSNILNYISSGNLKELFGKTIAKIQKWEEYSISLLRDFTFYELIKSNEDIDQTSGLNKIWELIKSKELEIETKKSIIQVFQQIFTRKECTEKIKETILIKSLNDIQSNPIIHLKLIQNIIDTYPLKSSMKFYYTHEDRESLIKKLQSSLKILDLLTDELLDFKKQFENLQSQNQFSIPKSQSKESMNLIKMEQHDYNYNIAIRFDLLKTIISDLIQFSSEQIEKLWQSFVENPRDEMEMDLFFQFLISIKFSNQFVSVLFQKAEKLNPETMTPKGFQFFQHFCYQINLIEKIIDGSDANFQVKDIMTSNEFGIESLWKIALLSKDPDVKKLSANFLIQFQIFRYDIILKEEEKVKERREQFISKCINYLSDNKNPNVQNRTIDILTAFIEKIEQTTINADSTKKINQDIPVSLNLKITNLDEKTEETTMVVYGNQTVKEFRNELAKLLDAPLTSFTVSHPLIQKKHDLLTLEDVGLYVAPIKELAIKILRRSDSKPKIKEIHSQDNSSIQIKKENLPSFLLSKYFDKLFQFLAIKEHGTAAKIWNLLMKMPKDKGFLLSFYQLCEDRQEYPEWKQKLQSLDCSYKLIYGLQIIQQFLEYPESVTQELGKEVDRQKWIQTFIRVDGVEYLVKNLVDIPLDQDKDDHECFEFQKSTALILKMIYQLLVNEDSKFRTDIQIKNFPIGIILNKLIDLTIKFGSTESKQTSEESVNLINDIVSYSVKIIVQGCLTEQEEWRNSLKRYPEISIWLKRSLVDSPVNSVREILANGIIKISKNDIDSSPQKNRERQDEEPFRIFFLKNLMKFMEEILDIEPKPEKHDHIIYYEQYFKVVQELINLGYTSNDKMELKNLVYQMIQVIKTYPITEKENSTDKEADERLIGQFNLIRTITSHEKSLKMEIEQKEMVIEELFNQFLFGIPQMQPNQTDIQMHEVTPPKCKAPKTRKACFELVCELSRDCFDNFKAIMSLLNQKHSKFEDMDTWNYSPQYYSQSSTGYRGLTNLGATCYMNSLLQQLFMIQEFRDAILTLDFEKENEKEKNLEKKTIPNEDKISYQLQRIFWYLTKTELGFVNTKLLCNTFKDWENKPLRTSVQMDAEEFLNILFNNLETEISDKEQKNILRDLFRGTFINQVIPIEAESVKSERNEDFFRVSVDVESRSNLHESLDLFVEGEMLVGDNQYYSEALQKKVDAMKRICIGNLPKILIIHLKRFQYNYETFQRYKINKEFHFPMQVKMGKYTKEGLEKSDQMKKLESEQNENEDEPNKQNESNESMPIPKEVEQISSENDGEEYELVGIIVHNGSTESGHYYSLIKEPKTSKWIRFDDIRVLEFDMSDLAEECFGKGGIIVPNANDYYDSNEKRNSAYLLIYRKITQYPQNDLDSPQKSTQITQESIPQKFYQEIIQENLQFRAKKYLFNNDYFDFCFSILELGQQTYSNSLTSLTTNLTQFAMKFLINLIAHFKNKENSSKWVEFIKKNLDTKSAKWFIQKFTNQKYSKVKDQDQDQEEEEEDWYSKCILKMGPINEFRLQIYSIIIEALKILANEEKTKISSFNLEEKKRNEAHLETLQENEVYEYWMSMQMMRQIKDEPKKQTEVSLVIEFASQLLQTLPEAKFHFSALSDYFGFLYDLLSVGEAVIEYFASTNLIAKMIDFYLDEKSPLRKTANNKQNQSQVVEDSYFQQQFVKMLSIIEEIVLKTENKINKSQEIDEKKSLVLSKIDYRMITEEKFIEKMISLEINPESLKKILNHISFENIEFTQHIIELLSREMKSKTYLEIGRYFTFYNSLLEINDSLSQQRLDLVLSKLKDSISQKFSFENSTSVSLNYLGELCKSNAAAMEWFLGNKDKWMIEWLVQNRYLAARNSVLQFIAIFFNYKESEKDQINAKILLEFEDYFISILPKIKEECYQGVEKEKEEMKNLNKSKISDDFFQMTSYFDFFRMYCLEQKEAAEKLFANFDMFWECMEYIDKVMLNYDLNKKHLLMLFEACFRIYPDQLNQQLINNKERTEKYLQLFDSFQEHNAYITEYLQSTLKLYFQILQQCLNQNEEFANLLKSSKLFKVSIMEILFKSQDFYSEIGDIILKTFGMFALKQKDYRLEQINMISSNVYEFLNNSPITTIKFLDQMIIDKEDAWMFYKTENNFYYLQLIITVFASQMHQQNSNFRSLRDIIMHIYQIRNSRFDNKGANQAILHGLSLVDKMTKLLGTDIRNIEDFVINQKMLSVLYQVVPFIGGIDEEVSNKYFEVSSTLILSNPMLVINFINQIISFHHANIESHRLEELRSEHTGTKSNLDDKVFFSINEYHHFLESIVFAGLKLNQKQVDDFQKRIEEMETESRKKYQSENENQNENENENQNENQNQNQNENQNENSQNEIESIRLRAIKLLFFILVDISRYELFNSRFLKFSNKLISLYPDDFKEAFGQYQDYLVLYFEKTIEKCIVVFNNEWIFFQEFIKFLNSKNDQNSNQILSNLLSKIFLGIENRKNDSSITRLEELKVLLISAKIILFETKNSQEMIKLFVGNVFGSDSLGWIFEQFQNNQEIIDLASFLISYF